jgi:predicted enzyme related to lactoylglutathione lyase
MLPVCVQSVYVPNLQEAIDFYAAALGYEVEATYGGCIAQLRTGGTTLILQEIEPGGEPASPATVLAFRTDDIHASMRRVVQAGGELLHRVPQPCPVGVFVGFRDKAGVAYELLQFDPRPADADPA